jgi:FlaA1/EpsC-like NDP-sugar epimerase
MKVEGKGGLHSAREVNDTDTTAFIITGGCGSIGGAVAKQIIAKGGIAVVG